MSRRKRLLPSAISLFGELDQSIEFCFNVGLVRPDFSLVSLRAVKAFNRLFRLSHHFAKNKKPDETKNQEPR